MSRTVKKRGALFGAALAIGTTLAVVIGLGVLAGGGAAASSAAPTNTSPPTITGTPREGDTLTGDRGQWSNSPTAYSYVWTRCDKTGGSCSNISGAQNTKYALTSADVGNTLRFRVDATNADGSASATSVPTAVIQAKITATAPKNTSPPTLSGIPEEGQTLTANPGTYSGTTPISYVYQYRHCNKNGGGCSNSGGTTTQTIYKLTAADVGNTLRVHVRASNSAGSTTATSAPTAVIAAAAKPPPTTGCPTGTGPVQVANVTPPARLLIDQQQTSPAIVNRGTRQLTVRYHVSACGGRSVQGALVYATAVPFNQLSIPPEQTTGSNGWAQLNFQMLAGFPVSSNQQLIAIFTRARKSGEDLLGGISTRRLFSVRVNLKG